MATKTNTIIIERKSALSYALMPMHIVIDDMQSVNLSNGESAKIIRPKNKQECMIQVKDHTFKVVNVKQVKKIVLKYGFVGIKCSIVYDNGQQLDVLNKNPGADVANTIWVVLLVLMVLVMSLKDCSSLSTLIVY